MSKHTPGPWEYSAVGYQVTGADGTPICNLNGYSQRNAPLITSAPDLLHQIEGLRADVQRLSRLVFDGNTYKSALRQRDDLLRTLDRTGRRLEESAGGGKTPSSRASLRKEIRAAIASAKGTER